MTVIYTTNLMDTMVAGQQTIIYTKPSQGGVLCPVGGKIFCADGWEG